jgi:hypothetical protein
MVFVNETNYKLVMTAKKVTACQLTPREELGFTTPKNLTYEEGKSVEVPLDVLAELRAELQNPAAYLLITPTENKKIRGGMGCLTVYRIRFRFESDTSEIGVNFCFGCNDIAISRGEKFIHEVYAMRGDAKFLDISLRLFPDDEGLKRGLASRQNRPPAAKPAPAPNP